MRAPDPLAEEAEEAAAGPCTRCDHGWIDVQPAYALHLFPDPSLEQLADLPPEAVEELHRQLAIKRSAASNSVYPCKRCRPALFYRWVGGHFRQGHDPFACDECIELMGGKRAARRAARAYPDHPVPTPRRDLE